MSPKRRKPVRLPEECIHTIAQTLGITVSPEAAKFLAPNAEYQLRKLIQSSKSYMRHSKRSRLITRDVSRAHKAHFGKSLFGHHGQNGAPGFVQVTNGIFVEAEAIQIQALKDLYMKPLPRVQRSGLEASFLTTGKPLSTAALRAATESIDNFVKCMRAILVSRDDSLLDATLRNMPEYGEAQVRELISLSQHLTHSNATQSGDTIVLCYVLRLLGALLIRNRVQSEIFNDNLLPIILTCLLDKHPLRLFLEQLMD
ncbi:unnamed protein product [Agarophyton chilense]